MGAIPQPREIVSYDDGEVHVGLGACCNLVTAMKMCVCLQCQASNNFSAPDCAFSLSLASNRSPFDLSLLCSFLPLSGLFWVSLCYNILRRNSTSDLFAIVPPMLSTTFTAISFYLTSYLRCMPTHSFHQEPFASRSYTGVYTTYGFSSHSTPSSFRPFIPSLPPLHIPSSLTLLPLDPALRPLTFISP